MKLVYLPLKFLTISSLWEPIGITPLLSKIYKIYRYIIVACHIFCLSGESIYAIVLIVKEHNFQDSNEALFIVMTGVLILIKTVTSIVKKQQILQVLNDFTKEPFAPKDHQEVELVEKCEENLG